MEQERLGLLKDKQSIEAYKTLTKDDRTSAIKNYEFYVEQEKTANKTPKSFAEWEKDVTTGNYRDYQKAVEGGYDGTFHEWMLEMRRAGAPIVTLAERAEVDISKRFRSPEYKDRIFKEEIGDPFTGFISGLSPAQQKLKMRRRVFSDLKRAFPGSDITGKSDANGVVFYKDGERILVWTDPEITEVK